MKYFKVAIPFDEKESVGVAIRATNTFVQQNYGEEEIEFIAEDMDGNALIPPLASIVDDFAVPLRSVHAPVFKKNLICEWSKHFHQLSRTRSLSV